ncbi:family 16 glycosylhydrolase [Eubacterium sp.]|uniref:family 16 glycosylhydrolase n=1 Tax=Eubacterium sp. TaxID=142586 RepID=UPI00351FADCE
MGKIAERIFMITLIGTLLGFGVKNINAATKSTQYKMVWSDEFNGTKLNLKNWTYDIGNGGANFGWGNNELEYYTDREDNVKVENGSLVITARADNYKGPGMKKATKYTSGRIKTSNLQSFKYGKIEARMKVPAVTGMWPAFWMLGYNDKGWPYCGEIDILETWNSYQFAQGTIHWENEKDRPGRDTYEASSTKKFKDKTAWHTYGLIWTPKQMQWTVDGKVYKTFSLKESHKSELKKPFYIILNLAVGGNLPYFPPEDDFVSEKMMVDYVRVYQRKCDNGSYDGVWEESEKSSVPVYSVKFSNITKVLNQQKVLAGETIILPNVKRKGYKFLGWYNGDKKLTESTMIKSDITAKAKWQKISVKQTKITSTKQIYRKMATVKYKVKGKVDGYQIKVGKKTKYSESKIVTFGKFVSGKTYKVKVRAYSIDSRGKKIFGKWSKTAKITIK